MNREKLLQVIEKVKPGITNIRLIEQNNLILFNTKTVKSYNDEILIIVPIKIKIEGALPANEFIALLQKMKDEKIEINQKDKVLEITGQSTKAKLKIIDVNFPKIKLPEKWETISEDFIEGIKHCKYTVSQLGILNNILIIKDKIISCDNYRITEYSMEQTFKKQHLIPSSTINILISFLPTLFSSNKQWLFFKNKDEVIVCIRNTREKYPDIESILNSKIKGIEIKLPDELKESLQRTKILSDEDIVTGNRMITITIKDNKLICHGECIIGEIEDTIKIDYEKKKISFAIVPDFLSEILDNKIQTVIIGDSSLNFKSKNLQHRIRLIK